jgi:uncharacterized phosphatase
VTVTTICLVRHGETDWNLHRRYQGWEDIPLNETGQGQAQVVALAIAAEEWDAIVASPLSRALATAQAIAIASRTLDANAIATDHDLRERGYGDAEGMTLEERTLQWAGNDWPNLEPYDVMAERAMGALDRVVAAHPGQRVLVVCHGGLINAVLATISGGEVGTGKTVILNTARTFLTNTDGAWSIDVVTDTSHLELAAALEH